MNLRFTVHDETHGHNTAVYNTDLGCALWHGSTAIGFATNEAEALEFADNYLKSIENEKPDIVAFPDIMRDSEAAAIHE